MGGSALKSSEIKRLNKNEFYSLQTDILKKLHKLKTTIIPVKPYRNKSDFGDMDILVEKNFTYYNNSVKELLVNEFKSKEIVKNGDIISFEYKNFQVDLLFEEFDNLEIADVYYSYNIMGNIIGKIFHKFNLKFGFQGLYLPLRTSHGNMSSEVLLSKDPKQIFNFIGLDYDRYLKGFDELHEIFEYVATSKYFSPSLYIKETKSQIDKRRELRNASYIEFLDWLTVYAEANKNKSYFEFNEDKSIYTDMVNDYFPNAELKKKIAEWNDLQEKIKLSSEKFNGKMVMSMFPDLSGKALGEFIKTFKNNIINNDKIEFEDVIICLSDEEIKDKLLSHYKAFNVNFSC